METGADSRSAAIRTAVLQKYGSVGVFPRVDTLKEAHFQGVDVSNRIYATDLQTNRTATQHLQL